MSDRNEVGIGIVENIKHTFWIFLNIYTSNMVSIHIIILSMIAFICGTVLNIHMMM